MRMVRTVAPTSYPVSLVEVKSHLNILHADWDAKLDAFIAAVTGRLDGYEGTLGRAIMLQTWTMYLDCFHGCIEIPIPPFVSLDDFQYLNSQDEWVEMVETDDYLLDLPVGDKWPAVIRPPYQGCWPTAKDVSNSIRITFTAGYPLGRVPEEIKLAMMMTISSWNENREAGEIPEAARTLLAPIRRIPV